MGRSLSAPFVLHLVHAVGVVGEHGVHSLAKAPKRGEVEKILVLIMAHWIPLIDFGF